MTYNYKTDYEHIFDTPAKKQQESVIVNKIMDLLNKNKYDDIHDFIKRNDTYQDFLKNNNLETVVKHFGNTLNETDYKNILNAIVKVSEKKNDFEKDKIQTKNVDGKEYTIYDGEKKDYIFDNSHSNMTIERQMEELQKTQNQFQSTDGKKNTDLMMEELEKEKKESLHLQYLHEIDLTKLNKEQKDMFNLAANIQLDSTEPIRIDFERKLLVTESNDIMKIDNRDGNLTVIDEKNEEKDVEKGEAAIEPKINQKKLMPSPNTIYSSNN
jgi:hypothetical protein